MFFFSAGAADSLVFLVLNVVRVDLDELVLVIELLVVLAVAVVVGRLLQDNSSQSRKQVEVDLFPLVVRLQLLEVLIDLVFCEEEAELVVIGL